MLGVALSIGYDNGSFKQCCRLPFLSCFVFLYVLD